MVILFVLDCFAKHWYLLRECGKSGDSRDWGVEIVDKDIASIDIEVWFGE
jgi:hypothetical protein